MIVQFNVYISVRANAVSFLIKLPNKVLKSTYKNATIKNIPLKLHSHVHFKKVNTLPLDTLLPGRKLR